LYHGKKDNNEDSQLSLLNLDEKLSKSYLDLFS